MVRTRVARTTIEELRRRIQLAEKAKEEYTEYLQKLEEKYTRNEISYSDYIESIYQHREGRTIQEWIEYFDYYIQECKKRIKEQKRDIIKNQLTLILFSSILILILVASSVYLRPTLTGLFVQEEIPEIIPEEIVPEIPTIEIFNDHQWAFYYWKKSQLENKIGGNNILIHIDHHEDHDGVFKLPKEITNLTELKNYVSNTSNIVDYNYISAGIYDGLISEIYWITKKAGEPKETVWEYSLYNDGLILTQLGCIQENCLEPDFKVKVHIINSSSQLPDLRNKNVILSIDLDYFILAAHKPEQNQVNIEIDELVKTVPRINPKIITIAESRSYSDLEKLDFTRDRLKNKIEKISETPIEIPTDITIPYISITTTQQQAILGQPVKWTKTVYLDKPAKTKIRLPIEAVNISVNKIIYSEEKLIEALQNQTSPYQEESLPSSEVEGAEEKQAKFSITGAVIGEGKEPLLLKFFRNIRGAITGRVIEKPLQELEIEINDTATEYEIEYETPAPYAIEEELERGKRIKLVGPETVHYENVLAFTELDEKLKVTSPSRIKIYWIEDNSYINPSSVEDRDNNGIYDYIEWIAPVLSEQTFEIIIITKAEHLNANREFISDIYEEVRYLDGVWSETIPAEDYVRVTFEKELDNTKDITIYPRIVSGNPRVEVYEIDGTELIAEFTDIISNQYNKVYLTNLVGSQDTFDLQVLDGSIEIDHIVDPTIEELAVTACTAAGCSPSGLNTYSAGAPDMIIAKTGTESVNMSASGSSPGDTINSVSLFIRHGGETADISDYLQDNCGVETTGPGFRYTNGTLICTCPQNSVPNSFTYADHSCTPTGCGWTPAMLDDLAIYFCNDDGGRGQEAYIDFINVTVNYSGVVADTPPTWQNNQDNDTGSYPEKGDAVLMAAEGNDDLGLWQAILSTNETGSWENSSDYGSPMELNNATILTWSNFTWSNSSLKYPDVVGWRIWYRDNKSTSQYNVTDILSFQIKDATKPKWRNPGTNDSDNIINQGEQIKLVAQGWDFQSLDWAVLSTNETGVFVNYSIIDMSDAEATWTWSNFTWDNSSFYGTLGFQIWYNDTAGNYNVTDVFTVTVTEVVDNEPYYNTTSGYLGVNTTIPNPGDTVKYYSWWWDDNSLGLLNLYTLEWNETGGFINQTWQSSPGNNTWHNYSIQVPSSAEGKFISARIWLNDSENQFNSTTLINITVQNINPIAAFGTNPADLNESNSQSITFDLKCSDNFDVNILRLYGNWTGIWHANQTNSTPINDTTWSILVDGIPQGKGHAWAVWCNDSVGNENMTGTNRTFTVDITAPTVTLPVYPNATKKKNTENLTLNISVDDGSGVGVDSCVVNVETGAGNQTITYSNGWCNGTYNLAGASDGNKTINAYANDTLGNTGLNNNYVVWLDSTAPTITLPVYTNATPYRNDSSMIFNISVIDAGVGADDCTINVNTASAENVTVEVVSGWCNGTYNLAGASDGNQTINAYANDTLGNTGLNNNYVVWLDSTAPIVVSLDYPENNSVINSGLVDFNFTATDNFGLANCSLYADFTGWAKNETVLNPANDTQTNITVNPPEGTYIWNILCYDNTANPDWYTYNYTVTIDETNPNATINQPGNDTWTTDNSPNINITLTDNLANPINYTFYLNDTANKTGVLANNTPTNITMDVLSDSLWLIIVEATDNASNSYNSSTLYLKIDSTAPIITLPVYPNATEKKSSDDLTLNISVSDATTNPESCSVYVAGQASNQTITYSNGWCNTTTFSLANANQGNSTIYIYANDTVGNWGLNDSYVVWIDDTPPFLINTGVNATFVNASDMVCINTTATDSGVGLDKVWVYITYPNSTQANATMSDTGSCAGGDVYSVDINVGSITGNLTINTSYANDTLNNLGNQTPWPNLQVNVTTPANNPPTIAFVSVIPDQTPNENGINSTTFTFNATDLDGASDINVSTAQARFNRTGETTRVNSSCVNLSSGGDNVNFSCTIDMWYYDGNGDWTINVTIKDNSGASGENSSTTFQYNLLPAMAMSPISLGWPEINLSDTNTSSDDIITINNTGNKVDLSINITGLDLQGEGNPTQYIYAANISVENKSDGCGGTAMLNATSLNVTSAILQRGNNSLNYLNATSGQEQLFFCVTAVNSDLSAQSYSSSAFGAWEISILLVAVIPARKRRQKKKKKRIEKDKLLETIGMITDELKEKYTLSKSEIMNILIKEMRKKYKLTRKEVMELSEVKKMSIPITIFSKKLGSLESLVKYMKENLEMNYNEIAEELNRDQRTIWTAYKKAKEKQKEPIDIKETDIFLPTLIFKNRKLTVLESIIIYLKEKGMKYSEIAELLNRDQRNIWTIYSRAVKKLVSEK